MPRFPRTPTPNRVCIFCSFRSATAPFSTSPSIRQQEQRAGPTIRRYFEKPARNGKVRPHYLNPFWDPLDKRIKKAIDSDSIKNRDRPEKDGKDDPIFRQLTVIASRLDDDSMLARAKLEPEELDARWVEFRKSIIQHFGEAGKMKSTAKSGGDKNNKSKSLEVVERLRSALAIGVTALEDTLKIIFLGQLFMARFSSQDLNNQKTAANLHFPNEWYPATRAMKREFHMHVGPTNSGKTYHALKRLEQAQTGVYAGPLRLLAHEVYMRLNASGRRCNLVTGDERKAADDNPEADMISCTVEMTPFNVRFDVAVIDEIQLLGSAERGWAWTQAVLGIQAREIHVCGEERAVPIMEEIAALCGEKLKIHRYERLTPLKMLGKSLEGDVTKLQKGDCVVCFSIIAIHALRQTIEKALQCKVAIIYGSLPPETRAQQARLFNDPNNDYDILVASDAVGMGLNLSVNLMSESITQSNLNRSIKRMIFQTTHKFIGRVFTEIPVHEMKQIAGRAGRYSTAEQDMNASKSAGDVPASQTGSLASLTPLIGGPDKAPVGLVTSLEPYDYSIVKTAMEKQPVPIPSAGIMPPPAIVARFARYFPAGMPLSFLLTRLLDIAVSNSRFHLCGIRQYCSIADAIESVEGLSLMDRLTIVAAPSEPIKEGEAALIKAYAETIANCKTATILDYPELDLSLLEHEGKGDRILLKRLEALHKGIVLWMWLSFRFEVVFRERELALYVKGLVEDKIAKTIDEMAFNFEAMRKKSEQNIINLLSKQGTSIPVESLPSRNTSMSATGLDAGVDADKPTDSDLGQVDDLLSTDDPLRAISSDEDTSAVEIDTAQVKLDTVTPKSTGDPKGHALGSIGADQIPESRDETRL